MDTSITKIDRNNLDLLDLIIRTTNIYGIKPYVENNQFEPILKKGYIVKCQFTGIGNELNFPHYAIVWNVDPSDETVNIIPLTSQKKGGSLKTLALGKITDFITKDSDNNFVNKDSYLYINKMMESSRKRLKLVYAKYPDGSAKRDHRGKLIPLTITEEQILLITKAIKLYYINDGDYLFNILSTLHTKYFIDLNTLSDDILSLGYRYIDNYEIVDSTSLKTIKFFIDNKEFSITMREMDESNWKKYKSINHKSLYNKIDYISNIHDRRVNIIYNLFSEDPDLVLESKNIISDIFN